MVTKSSSLTRHPTLLGSILTKIWIKLSSLLCSNV